MPLTWWAMNGRSAAGQTVASPQVELPVRRGTTLTAGMRQTTACPNDSRCSAPRSASAVRPLSQDALPMRRRRPRAGVLVEVSERVTLPGASWRSLQTLRTDEDGAFRYSAPRGQARTLRFQYAGTPTDRPAASEEALRVRAASTLQPSRRKLRNGETVVLRGRLLGRPVPAAGKVVTLQAWTSRGWWTFGTARARREGRALELSLHVHRHLDDLALSLPGPGPARGGLPVRDWRVARRERARSRGTVRRSSLGTASRRTSRRRATRSTGSRRPRREPVAARVASQRCLRAAAAFVAARRLAAGVALGVRRLARHRATQRSAPGRSSWPSVKSPSGSAQLTPATIHDSRLVIGELHVDLAEATDVCGCSRPTRDLAPSGQVRDGISEPGVVVRVVVDDVDDFFDVSGCRQAAGPAGPAGPCGPAGRRSGEALDGRAGRPCGAGGALLALERPVRLTRTGRTS